MEDNEILANLAFNLNFKYNRFLPYYVSKTTDSITDLAKIFVEADKSEINTNLRLNYKLTSL